MSSANQSLEQLNSTIGTFANNVDVKVQQVNEITKVVKANADKTYNEINKFKQEMVENEQMQNAQENILRINQIIREQFYDYDDIRKTVMGVIMDFDMNLVRNKTIKELSEELWITSSRYWLSYTLIALSGWVNNDKEITSTAVSESYRTDKVKTSLFFCLMNLRFNRFEPARKWLCEYFSTIVPEDIQDETAVMILAYINGLFGNDKQIEFTVTDLIDGWIKNIDNDEEEAERLTNIYENYIININVNCDVKQEFLQTYCNSDCLNTMVDSYRESCKYDFLIKKVDTLNVDNINCKPGDYKARVDHVLRDLITNYDSEENELKEQQEYYNLIIENKGKQEIADKQFLAILQERNKKQNIGEKCVQWAILSDYKTLNVHVSKFGMQHTKSWLLESLNRWSEKFELSFPQEYEITIDDWKCISNGEDSEEQEVKLIEFLESNKFKIKFVNKANIILLIFAVIGLAFAVVSLVMNLGMIPAAIGGGIFLIPFIILLVRCLTATKKFNKKVNEKVNKLRGTLTELTEFRRKFAENKEKKATLYSKIEQL